MKQILLVCAAGMSTSLLVTKMEKAAAEEGVEIKIFALPISEARNVIDQVDCVLLGPQVRFQKKDLDKIIAGRAGGPIPSALIDMKDYGTMNGKNVFATAKTLLGI